MLIFDAHLDLSMNALEWNRDLTRSIDEIRARERGKTDKPDRGQGTPLVSGTGIGPVHVQAVDGGFRALIPVIGDYTVTIPAG